MMSAWTQFTVKYLGCIDPSSYLEDVDVPLLSSFTSSLCHYLDLISHNILVAHIFEVVYHSLAHTVCFMVTCRDNYR